MNKLVEMIKRFFYKIIKKEKVMLIEEKNEKIIEDTTLSEKNEFKNRLDIRKEQEIIELQKKYESGEIIENKLSPIQVIQLLKLYEKQVKDLDTTIKMQELMLCDIFEYLLQEIELYRIFIMDPGLSGYLNKLKATIKRNMQLPSIKTDKQKIAFEFIFEGVYGTIIEWIKNDYAPKEEIALQLAHLLNNNWKLIFDDEHLITILRKRKK